MDLGLALGLGGRVELTELAENVIGFEVDAFDLVIVTAALDGGPVHDAGSGRTKRVAHVRLLKDFFGPGASAAIGEELFRGELSALDAIDDIEQAEFSGIRHSDAKIEVPGRVGNWSDGVLECWRNG